MGVLLVNVSYECNESLITVILLGAVLLCGILRKLIDIGLAWLALHN